MFATVAPEHPAAAWFKINDPIKDFDRSSSSSARVSWSARGPTPTRARPAPATSPSATRPWRAGPVRQHRLRRARSAVFGLFRRFPAARSPVPTPSAAIRPGARSTWKAARQGQYRSESRAANRAGASAFAASARRVRKANDSISLLGRLVGRPSRQRVASLVGCDEDGEIACRRDPDRGVPGGVAAVMRQTCGRRPRSVRRRASRRRSRCPAGEYAGPGKWPASAAWPFPGLPEGGAAANLAQSGTVQCTVPAGPRPARCLAGSA